MTSNASNQSVGTFSQLNRRTKLLIVACAIYLISPIDFIPDFIPVFGQLDDLGAFLFAVMTAAKSAKSEGMAQA